MTTITAVVAASVIGRGRTRSLGPPVTATAEATRAATVAGVTREDMGLTVAAITADTVVVVTDTAVVVMVKRMGAVP